jgi:L-2-hydroxyglutarate oxidase LhgO
MTLNSCNIAIIGGGIVGCALARELAQRFDKVLLIEKENGVGLHTSGRNSGVVHSGFNPRPGTLKAQLCVEGARRIRQFCSERKVPFQQVGTLVVARTESELPVLTELKSRGEKNGVPELEILSEKVLREHEPNAKGIAALYSPTGAIVDSQALARAVADDAQESGVNLTLGQEVRRIVEQTGAVQVSTEKDTYTAQLVVNCAGLHADRLGHMMGVGKEYVIAPFRGEYFVVNRPGKPVIRSMVYPIPNPLVPFLGVHLTRTVSGSVLIGPNAVPAFGREAYRRTAVNIKDLAEMLRHRGFWNAFVRNRELIKIAFNELKHSCSKRHFLREASKLVSGLQPQDLRLGSRVGIRPQLIKSDGNLVEDIVIETTPHSIHILNVVSPGMTSSLAFAKWLSMGIDNRLTWIGWPDTA